MSTVTIPRELAQSLLVLMTRSVTDGTHSVPRGQWLTFANALDKAMHAPGPLQIAPGSTIDRITRAMAVPTPGAPQASTQGDPRTFGLCRFCRLTTVTDGGICAPCADDLQRDVAALEQATHTCPRCDRA